MARALKVIIILWDVVDISFIYLAIIRKDNDKS